MREQLLCYALRYEGDWKKMKLALDRQEPWTRMAYEGSYVTIADQAYPDKLRRLACPPWILFYEGDMTPPETTVALSVVGRRRWQSRTTGCVDTICTNGAVIVSGLARGIDGQAHRSALDRNTAVVNSLWSGCRISKGACVPTCCYAKKALIIEYPNGNKALRTTFHGKKSDYRRIE